MMANPEVARLLPKYLPGLKTLTEKNAPGAADALARMRALVAEAPASELALLAEHLAFPAELYLDRPWASDNYTVDVMDYLSELYRKVPADRPALLESTVDRLMLVASTGRSASEDVKLAVCRCLTSLFSSAPDETLLAVYSAEQAKLRFSQLTLAVISWIEEARTLPSMTRAGCDLFKRLWLSSPRESSAGLRNAFGSTFLDMLPGVSTKLMKLLKDKKVSPKSKALLLLSWTQFVTLILSDDHFARLDLESSEEEYSTRNDNYSSEKWLNLARDHLSNQMSILLALSSASLASKDGQKELQKALRHCASSILKKCSRSLTNLKPSCIEILSHHFEAEQHLNFILKSLNEDERSSLAARARENTFELTQTLCKPPALFESEEVAVRLGNLRASVSLVAKLENDR